MKGQVQDNVKRKMERVKGSRVEVEESVENLRNLTEREKVHVIKKYDSIFNCWIKRRPSFNPLDLIKHFTVVGQIRG